MDVSLIVAICYIIAVVAGMIELVVLACVVGLRQKAAAAEMERDRETATAEQDQSGGNQLVTIMEAPCETIGSPVSDDENFERVINSLFSEPVWALCGKNDDDS